MKEVEKVFEILKTVFGCMVFSLVGVFVFIMILDGVLRNFF